MANEQEKFKQLYEILNPEQKSAVDIIEGPVMVVAGPGTGKTQILTLRIANILRQTDIGPRGILALTFTEAAAASMRRRLANIIGLPAYEVTITTFHSFCNSIIQEYPESFPEIIGSESITELEQINIIETKIDQTALNLLKPKGDPLWYVHPILSAINTLKREGVTADQFEAILQKERKDFEAIEDLYHGKGKYKGTMKGIYQTQLKTIEKNTELLSLYRAYETSLREQKIYDYSDMILKVRDCLTGNQELLLNLQERYQYILIDEHQDTNKAQNNILELLANFYDQPNLFVVGDEKQAIFRFQGATPENFRYFKKKYPEAKIITLTSNYRSPQIILETAHRLFPESAHLAGVSDSDTAVRIHTYPTQEIEIQTIAKEITMLLKKGEQAKEIAIIYRNNADASAIAEALKQQGILFQLQSDQHLFEEPIIRKVITILRAIDQIGSDDLLVRALFVDFLNPQPIEIFRTLRTTRANKKTLTESVPSSAPLAKLIAQFCKWKILAENENPLDVISTIIRDSGCLTYISSDSNQLELATNLKEFFELARQHINKQPHLKLSEFLKYIDSIEQHEIKIKKKHASPRNAIQLMTAHGAKGLEFNHVYLVHCIDGRWGGNQRRDPLKLPTRVASLFDQNDIYDDERNILYVALTRAKQTLTISNARTSSHKETLPSRYLSELEHESQIIEDEITLAEITAPKQKQHIDLDTIKEFVKEAFLDQGFSITALNNYLECPWRYFYENLLQIPRTPSVRQRYGTAIHKALNDFFVNGMASERQILLEAFEQAIRQQPLSESESRSLITEGVATLNSYYQTYLTNWQRPVLTEFKVPAIQITQEIKIRGMIDRIDLLEPVTYHKNYRGTVHVVDYKTGKSKSRNVIEGNTQSSDGNYKRQLIFYNLLLNHYDNGRLQMQSGEIDFVEPDEKGKFKKEKFVITTEELKNLERTIQTSASEIISLAFWDQRCGKNDCNACILRTMMY